MHNTGQSGDLADFDIDAPEAWDLNTSGAAIVIGSIDTGVDPNYEDLAANLWTNPGEVAGNGDDDDANGYVDDVHGWDFLGNDNYPQDDHSHGSHTMGTAAAVGNNGKGVAGAAWSAVDHAPQDLQRRRELRRQPRSPRPTTPPRTGRASPATRGAGGASARR